MCQKFKVPRYAHEIDYFLEVHQSQIAMKEHTSFPQTRCL